MSHQNTSHFFILSLAAAGVFVPASLFAAADSIAPGSWTLAILPDTQYYSQDFPTTYSAQTKWIKDHEASHNIQYALHLGDIVNRPTNVSHWNNAKASMSILDGFVPYAMAPGNHDYGSVNNSNDRESLFQKPGYFGTGSPYASQASIGGFYEAGKTDNSFHTFSVNQQEWLVLALEFGPRNSVVDWANNVVGAYPNHNAVLITHAYMYSDSTRYDWATKGDDQNWNPHLPAYGISSSPEGVNDGEELWDNLVSKHDNFRFVFSGHVLNDGTGYLTSETDGGSTVHQILSNYQFDTNGGEGFLRYLEFAPNGDETLVTVRSYSPVLDLHYRDADQQFSFSITTVPEPLALNLASMSVITLIAAHLRRRRRLTL